jgi:L-alanine-DL-glutamate epimerase-like enolase superfamily enzyme
LPAAIDSAEVIPYSLPFKNPYRSARGELHQREMVLLRVRSAAGAFGLGEGVPLSLRGGVSLAKVTEELGRWAEDSSHPVIGFSQPARCAIETALLDLEAREAGVAVWKLLGAEAAAPVECNATLGAGEPLHVAQQALNWAQAGFGSFKLKVGVADDVDQVALVRRAVGPQARLRVDANGAWGPDDAVANLNAMHGEADLELAEQPCPSLAGLEALRGRTSVAIAADESVASVEEAELAAERRACEMATVKLSKVGGPREALRIAAVLPVYLSSALDGPVGIAAGGHTVQALPAGGDAGVAHGLATQRLLAGNVGDPHCELRDGFLHLPEGPGLGVEIDDAALARHRL